MFRIRLSSIADACVFVLHQEKMFVIQPAYRVSIFIGIQNNIVNFKENVVFRLL